jgi:hypothetical protein
MLSRGSAAGGAGFRSSPGVSKSDNAAGNGLGLERAGLSGLVRSGFRVVQAERFLVDDMNH